jgi:spore coat protein U-like protein
MAIRLVWAEGDAINIRIIQGATWTITVSLGSTDLAGATVAAKIRNKFADVASYVDLTATITATGVGTSSFTLSLTAAQTAALAPPTAAPDKTLRDIEIGPWDYEISWSGGPTVRQIKRGTAYLNQEATK